MTEFEFATLCTVFVTLAQARQHATEEGTLLHQDINPKGFTVPTQSADTPD